MNKINLEKSLGIIALEAQIVLDIFKVGLHPPDEDVKRALSLIVDIRDEARTPSLYRED